MNVNATVSEMSLLPATAARQEDERLMAGVCRRDLAAFEQLYRRYHAKLARFLLALTHDVALADEVLNDTMHAVWLKPESFHGASRLATWIFAIGYRKAMRALSRRKPVRQSDPETAEPAAADDMPDFGLSRAQLQHRLGEAMGRLSPDHRTVVDLTYFHELGYREIAEIMDCPVDTVKTRMFHARRQLRKLIAGTSSDWL